MTHVLTFVAQDPAYPATADFISGIDFLLKDLSIRRTGDIAWLAPDIAFDVNTVSTPSRRAMHELRTMLSGSKVDVFINPIENRRKALLLADMDSTIVTGETLDDLAAHAGIKDKIADITRDAMEGNLDFHEAIRARVALLKGLPESALHETLTETVLSKGAQTLVRTMTQSGATCILVSGGFTFFTEAIAAQAGFSAHHGNTLGIAEGILTGQVMGAILDKHAKLDFLNTYAAELGISPAQAMTIGDGANDLPMLQAAGLGIGYRPKETVAAQVDNIIRFGDLTAALYAQGYTQDMFVF
jgi:phosphoserine phosphatase